MIYSPAVKSRTGEDIPLFKNLHPMHSKYNPASEAELFTQNLKDGFIITGGIGGGFHIEAALKKFPDSFFVCIEADEESLEYVRSLNRNRKIEKLKNTVFITPGQLENTLLSNYLPQLYNNLTLGFQKTWEAENRELCTIISGVVKESLKKIKADYSVQSYFAKQWQKNIM